VQPQHLGQAHGHWLAAEADGVAGMLSLAGGMVAGGGVVVVVEDELLVDESVVVAGGLSRLLQPARPAMAAAMKRAPSRPAMARDLVVVVMV
jgi:hypothetical protein